MAAVSELETDIDLDTAKEALAGLKLKTGYAEAMRQNVPDTTYRTVVVFTAGIMGTMAVIGWLYVTTPWVRYFVTIAFGLLACFFLFSLFSRAATTAALGGVPRPAVVMWRRAGSDPAVQGGRLHLLLEHDEVDVAADAALFDLVRPGDSGVATTSGVGPALELHSFRRL